MCDIRMQNEQTNMYDLWWFFLTELSHTEQRRYQKLKIKTSESFLTDLENNSETSGHYQSGQYF